MSNLKARIFPLIDRRSPTIDAFAVNFSQTVWGRRAQRRAQRGSRVKEALWNFYIDSIVPFLRFRFWGKLLVVITVGTALVSTGYFLLFQYLNISFQSFNPSEAKPSGSQFAGVWTIAVALAAGAFALWRWSVDQRWRRVQYAQQLFREFSSKENTHLALRILDVKGDVELPANAVHRKQSIEVTEDLLAHSLLTFDQQEFFEDPYFRVRMIFDEFFTDLSMFQHHIDAGLLEVRDIRPYLAYWIKAMRGRGPVHTIRVAGQIDAFLRAFDYHAVLRLFRDIGPSLRTVECCIAPEIWRADRQLFQEIEKDALNWESRDRPSTPVSHRAARLVHGAPDKRFPIYLREYRLHSTIGGRYIIVIQSDFTDLGTGEPPKLEERAMLWDQREKGYIPIRELFENSAEAIKSLPAKIVRRCSPSSATIDLLAAMAPTKRSRPSGCGLDFHYPSSGIGEDMEDRGTIFWPLEDFEKYLSKKGRDIFAALAIAP